MKNSEMILGQRYKLNHGTGVYIGYEQFLPDGMTSDVIKGVTELQRLRLVFKLDPGHTWSSDDLDYYSMAREVSEI